MPSTTVCPVGFTPRARLVHLVSRANPATEVRGNCRSDWTTAIKVLHNESNAMKNRAELKTKNPSNIPVVTKAPDLLLSPYKA